MTACLWLMLQTAAVVADSSMLSLRYHACRLSPDRAAVLLVCNCASQVAYLSLGSWLDSRQEKEDRERKDKWKDLDDDPKKWVQRCAACQCMQHTIPLNQLALCMIEGRGGMC